MEIMAVERSKTDTSYGTARLNLYDITMISNALYEYRKNHGEALLNNLHEEWKAFQCVVAYGNVNHDFIFTKCAEERDGETE